MWLFIWDTQPSKVFVWDTPISKVFLWDTQVRPTAQAYRTFTIVWDEVSDPSQFFVGYQDDAVGMTQGSTDFDDFFWYSAVLLDASWNEVEEVTQSSPWILDMTSFQWALTWTANNVMIKFPRRGVKMSKSWTQVTLSITDDPDNAEFQYYAFTKWTTAKNNLYLWAYKWTFSDDNVNVATGFTSWTTYMKSRATWVKTLDISPCANQIMDSMRTATSKYNNWYSLITIYPRWYINCLYMMKYGNPNSQSVVWAWYTWWSETVAPWLTNSQTSATYWTSSNTQQVKLFWLEDWWWNVSEFLDGCFYWWNTDLTVDKTNSIFQNSDYATSLWRASSWFMKSIDGSTDGVFRNTSDSAWGSTTYYCDFCNSSASRQILAGYNYSGWAYAGAFFLIANSTYNAHKSIGARLMYL